LIGQRFFPFEILQLAALENRPIELPIKSATLKVILKMPLVGRDAIYPFVIDKNEPKS